LLFQQFQILEKEFLIFGFKFLEIVVLSLK